MAEDWEVGRLLRGLALLEIRAMATRRKPMEYWPGDDYVECIAWLANLCHNMPDRPLSARPWWRRAPETRPFFHVWHGADQAGREWILSRLSGEGVVWSPPAAKVAGTG